MNRLQFYIKSQTAHGLHSPSIYALYCELLNPYLHGRLNYEQLKEKLRIRYLDRSIVEMEGVFDPKQIGENTVILVQKPYRNEIFWNSVKTHQSVVQTVDIFDLGLIFFKPICPKQNFYLRKM
jgi:hypothetical protein